MCFTPRKFRPLDGVFPHLFPLFMLMMALLRVAFVGYNDSRWSNGSLGYLQLTKNATIYRSLYCNNLEQGWQTLDRIPA